MLEINTMKQRILYILVCVSVWMMSCDKEDALSPTKTPEIGYVVPQGDHDYDQKIVDWSERYNSFILYKFNMKEVYWTVNQWIESVENPEGSLYPYTAGIRAANADENYVGQQLELLEKSFLNLYPDTTLMRCLPIKLLLCSQLCWRTVNNKETFYNTYNSYDCMAFNWGNADVLTMTAAQKTTFKIDVNLAFLKRLLANKKIFANADFYAGVAYSPTVTNQNMYSRGFVYRGTKLENDAEYYIQAIISTTYEDLTAEVPANDYTFKGILNSTKDVNGLIRYRYDILVNHLKTAYGIDLQAIGDTVVN